MKLMRIALFLVTAQLLASFTWASSATDTTEYQIKAAYLYKFASYVEWPASAFAQTNTPFTIGVIGAYDVGVALNELKVGHSINNRNIEIKFMDRGESLSGVHMLFVGQRESAQLKSVLDPAQVHPVLIVTESENALTSGSIINFLVVEERVRFEVSVRHAERNGLKISARLLAVAQNIEAGATR